MQRIIDALTALPVNAVVTTGPTIAPRELQAPPHVAVLPSAPHDALMRRATVVVTHAGHGTVMRALLAGAPLLCMPIGRDQNDNAARIVARGAGLALPQSASAVEIGTGLQRLLREQEFAAGAGALGRAVAAETDPERVADIVEHLASGERPARAGNDLGRPSERSQIKEADASKRFASSR